MKTILRICSSFDDSFSEKAALSPKYDKFTVGNGTNECLGWWIAYVRSKEQRAAKTSCLKTSANWMKEAEAELEHVPFSKVREETRLMNFCHFTLSVTYFSSVLEKVANALLHGCRGCVQLQITNDGPILYRGGLCVSQA